MVRNGADLVRPLCRPENVNFTLEDCSIGEADPPCNRVSDKRTLAANLEPTADADVADNLPLNNDLKCGDGGLNLSARANRYTVAGEVDRSFHLAIDVKRFGSGDFTFNNER